MPVDSLAEYFTRQLPETIDLIPLQKNVNRHPSEKLLITPCNELLQFTLF